MTDQMKRGAIAWMTRNAVAANLLMLFIVIGGLLTAFVIKQEVFPEFDVDVIMVSVPYPGTSPEEVEQGIIMAIEESVRDIDGVKRIDSIANEGLASISLKLYSGFDANKALQDIKNAIDGIANLPEEAERPQVRLLMHKSDVISVIIYGDEKERVLFDLGEKIREDLLLKPEVATVKIAGVRTPEISIEISQDTLRNYGLTLEQVALKIRASSIDFAGGGVKTSAGEILLRVQERRDFALEYADIPIITARDGTVVRLQDIAQVREDFIDVDLATYFNGKRAIMITVASESNQTPIEVADAIKEYIKQLEPQLPETLAVTTFNDMSELYADRVNLLLRNGMIGLTLVLILLGLFLNLRLAFWVTLGIPISFLGALLFLPFYDVSINMISLFAFIMALGIVVDDAIVVGENVFFERKKRGSIEASIMGAQKMSVPVIFAVLTNVVAFIPMLFIEGVIGKVFKVIPIVVCLAFLMSLVEALFILPAHLAHSKEGKKGTRDPLGPLHERVSHGLDVAIHKVYQPMLESALNKRYLTIAMSVALLIVVVGYIASGRMEFSFGPKAEADIVSVGLELPYGSPVEQTERVQKLLVQAALRVLDQYGGDKVNLGILTMIGRTSLGRNVDTGITEGGHAANITILLSPSDERDFTGEEFSATWRREMGEIPGVENIFFQVLEMGPPAGKPIDIQLSHSNTDILEAIARKVADELENFTAARDIDDGFAPGKPQLNFQLKPAAYSLGLSATNIGRQVRSRFYGAEALRLQRGRHEVKVMIRLPESERRTEQSIEHLLIRTPMGGEIPLGEAATVNRDRAYTRIIRTDCKRVLHVTSEVQPANQKGSILEAMKKDVMPQLQTEYPNLSYSLEGEQRETSDSMKSLGKNYIIALILIYVMLGVIFRSYAQPLIIMASIPFGIIGAVIGHLLMGFNLSMISMLGITALSGVVLNDALILIHYANQQRLDAKSSYEAIKAAGMRRFRPIMLTTLTTFFGLAPMIFESSFQARILVPMAISLGYGILFGTLIILIIVPCMYLILEDIKHIIGSSERSSERNYN